MEKLTYKQAFDKITEAYIKGEIKPYERQFCFCGTLGATRDIFDGLRITWNEDLYGFIDYYKMEDSLLRVIVKEMTPFIPQMKGNKFANANMGKGCEELRAELFSHPNYEDALFNGMVAALEVLKQIHKERGENVEDFQFTKRPLLTIK